MTEFGAINVNNFVLPVCVAFSTHDSWPASQLSLPGLVQVMARIVTGVGSECLCQLCRNQCPCADTSVFTKVSWSQRWSLAYFRSSGPSSRIDTEIGWSNIFWPPSICVYIYTFFYLCQSAAQSCIPWCSYAGCTEDNLWSIVGMGHPQNCPVTNTNFSGCLRR